MFLSIIKVVIVPIAAGFIINHFFSRFTQNVVEILPLISTTAIEMCIRDRLCILPQTPL